MKDSYDSASKKAMKVMEGDKTKTADKTAENKTGTTNMLQSDALNVQTL